MMYISLKITRTIDIHKRLFCITRVIRGNRNSLGKVVGVTYGFWYLSWVEVYKIQNKDIYTLMLFQINI